jgi:hypothetical protein
MIRNAYPQITITPNLSNGESLPAYPQRVAQLDAYNGVSFMLSSHHGVQQAMMSSCASLKVSLMDRLRSAIQQRTLTFVSVACIMLDRRPPDLVRPR